MISNDEFEIQAFCFVFYNLLSLKQKKSFAFLPPPCFSVFSFLDLIFHLYLSCKNEMNTIL